MLFYKEHMQHYISRIKRLCEGYTMTKSMYCFAWVNHPSPSDRIKSCAYTPPHQYWKATVKWKFQNQMNGISPVEGGLLSGSCSNDRKSFLSKSVLRNWWRLVVTAPGLQIISLCLSSLHSVPLKKCFVSGGSLNSSSIFVIAALRLKSELNFEEVFLAKSRKVVWSIFCLSFVRCQQNALQYRERAFSCPLGLLQVHL